MPNGVEPRPNEVRAPRSRPVEPGRERFDPRRLNMQAEASLRAGDEAPPAGEQDRGRGRAGGQVGRRSLHQDERRALALDLDLDRDPAVVDGRGAKTLAPAV